MPHAHNELIPSNLMNPDLIRQVALLRVCPEIQVASLPAPDTTSGRAVVVARALQRALAGERPAPVAVEPLLSQMPLTDSESQVVRMISDLSKPNVETAVLRVASRRQDGLRIEELLQLRRSGLGISLLELYLRVMHSRSVAVPFVDLPDVCVGEDFCAVNQLFGLDLAEPRLARCLLMRRQNRSSKGPPLLQSEEQARLWKLCEDDLGDSEGEAPCDALRRVFPQEEGWQFEVLCDKGLPRRRFRASCVVSDVVPALVTFRWQHHTALIYLVSNFPELTCIPCREQDLLYVAARFCPTSRIQLLAAGASLHGCPWRRHPTESLVICSPAPLAWVCLRALASDPDAVRKVKTMLTLPESMHLIFDPALPLLGAAGGVASLCMNLDEVTRQLALDNLPQGPSVPPGLRFVLTETFEPFPDAPHVNFWAAAWLRVRSGQTRMSREDLVLSYVLERPAPDVASAALVLSVGTQRVGEAGRSACVAVEQPSAIRCRNTYIKIECAVPSVDLQCRPPSAEPLPWKHSGSVCSHHRQAVCRCAGGTERGSRTPPNSSVQPEAKQPRASRRPRQRPCECIPAGCLPVQVPTAADSISVLPVRGGT